MSVLSPIAFGEDGSRDEVGEFIEELVGGGVALHEAEHEQVRVLAGEHSHVEVGPASGPANETLLQIRQLPTIAGGADDEIDALSRAIAKDDLGSIQNTDVGLRGQVAVRQVVQDLRVHDGMRFRAPCGLVLGGQSG